MIDPGPHSTAGRAAVGLRVAFVGGGGTVGSSAAFTIAARGAAAEIVLIDARDNMACSHAMDLEQAVCVLSDTTVRAGDWADLAGCDVVVLSASLPERNVTSRDEYLAGNLDIVREAAGHLAVRCPEAVVIVATNPVDVFTTVLPRLTGTGARRFLGYCWNDTLRFRWALARELGVGVAEVDAYVLGEHGETQVPLFDRVSVRGERVQLSEVREREVETAVRGWFVAYQGLQSGRTSGWTSAVGLASMVEAIGGGDELVLPCSVCLAGEYGISGVALGVPARLGAAGAEEVVEFDLTSIQRQRLQAAARKVAALVEGICA